VPVLEFLAKYVAEPRYSRLLAGVTERMLDVYGSVVGQSPQVRIATHFQLSNSKCQPSSS
jgi:hypothetical protein